MTKRPSLRARIVAEARTWDRTPFLPQCSVKGSGADCKGFFWGVARELDLPEAASSYAREAAYSLGRDLPSDRLLEGFTKLFRRHPLDRPLKPADVLLLSLARRPVHIAIVTEAGADPRVMHASPKTGVRERPLRVLEHDFALHSVWSFRACR